MLLSTSCHCFGPQVVWRSRGSRYEGLTLANSLCTEAITAAAFSSLDSRGAVQYSLLQHSLDPGSALEYNRVPARTCAGRRPTGQLPGRHARAAQAMAARKLSWSPSSRSSHAAGSGPPRCASPAGRGSRCNVPGGFRHLAAVRQVFQSSLADGFEHREAWAGFSLLEVE